MGISFHRWFRGVACGSLAAIGVAASSSAATDIVIDVPSGVQTQAEAGYPTIASATSVTKTGGGTLVFDAANEYVGPTTISAGTLQLGNGGSTGSLSTSSAIENNGILAFNRTNAVVQGTDFSGAAISGTGGLTVHSGTVTLNTANIYAGNTTIGVVPNSAVVQARATLALGRGTILIDSNFSDSRLELSGDIQLPNQVGLGGRSSPSTSIKNVSGANTIVSSITLEPGGNEYTIESAGGHLSLSGNITPPYFIEKNLNLAGSGDGEVTGDIGLAPYFSQDDALNVTKSGAGTWTLWGCSYSGTTTVSAGTLVANSIMDTSGVEVSGGMFIAAGPDLLPNTAWLSVAGGTYELGGDDTIDTLTISGGELAGAGYTLTASTYNLDGGTVSANLGSGTVTISGDVRITGEAAGTATVSTGELLIDNQFTGSVSVATGAQLGGSGTITGNVSFGQYALFTFNSSAPLTVGGSVTFTNPADFGVDDIIGLSNLTPEGTYTLIAGIVDTTNLANFGAGNAYDLGDGKSAYFQQGSLQVTVVPEPSNWASGLTGLATLAFILRRRL